MANILVNTLFYAISPIVIYQFWKYLSDTLKLNDKHFAVKTKILYCLTILSTVLCMVNLVYPLYFSVNADGVYNREGCYWISLIFLGITMLMICHGLIVNKIPLRDRLTAITFVVLPTFAQAITARTFGVSTQYGAMLVSTVLMYGVLFSNRGRALAATEAELDMAAKMQTNMLPNIFPAFPQHKEFNLYATMDPAKEVGGDFFDFFLIDDDHLALVMADVSGKGVPAALFMMTARTMIKDASLTGLDPASVMFRVNERLGENNNDGLFVTVWLGFLEISTGRLTYADAGHEKLLLYQNGGWQFLPKGGCTALAVLEPDEFEDLPDSYLYRNETIQLAPGDAIFQYTDGVTEATNEKGEFFGDVRLLAAMNAAPDIEPEKLLPYLRGLIDRFVGNAEQFDDITMLGLIYKGDKG